MIRHKAVCADIDKRFAPINLENFLQGSTLKLKVDRRVTVAYVQEGSKTVIISLVFKNIAFFRAAIVYVIKFSRADGDISTHISDHIPSRSNLEVGDIAGGVGWW